MIKRLWHISPAKIFGFTRRNLKMLFNPGKKELHQIQSGYGKGINLWLIKDRYAGWSEMLDGTYDHVLFESLKDHLSQKELVIWDIGAHFGYNSLVFAKITSPDARILSFEPNLANIERFRENLDSNKELSDKITLHNYALSDADEQAFFYFSDSIDDSVSSGSYLGSVLPPLGPETYAAFQSTSLFVRSADSLIENEKLPSPHIIKIDVEGAEFEVLKGAKNLLTDVKPVLIIEIHHIKAMHEVSALLHELNYTTTILEDPASSYCKAFLKAEAKSTKD
jgi:FkbM family methyltransferase